MTLRLMQAALVLLVAACGSSTATTAQTGGGSDAFSIQPIATFESPWAMAFLPGSTRALVTEVPGRLWLVDTGSGEKQPVSGVPAVVSGGQGGLLDVVVSPSYNRDQLVYLTYSEPSTSGGSGLALARAKLIRGDRSAKLDGLRVIWRDPGGGRGGQFGAIIAFAPDGKSLFLSSGERQRFTPAQDPSSPLGKILHLTLDGKPAPGNPWAGRSGAATLTITDPPADTAAARTAPGRRVNWPGPNLIPAETWTLGHRNPYGLAFDASGRLWEVEMGPRGGDELNLIVRGKNYGWPLVSEGRNYDGVPIPSHSTRPGFEPPKLFWNPVISPTSLMIYSGKLFPQWKGSGFIGGLSGKCLVRVTFNGDSAAKAERWDMGARVRFVGEGPDGAIYLLEDGAGGRMLRLAPPNQSRR